MTEIAKLPTMSEQKAKSNTGVDALAWAKLNESKYETNLYSLLKFIATISGLTSN